jgi:DNA-binding transcriptional regulator LsrR (DeoR family)
MPYNEQYVHLCGYDHMNEMHAFATLAPDHARLLVKIAHAYYDDGLTQKEIGERLGLSRIKVSRLLREARETGVVQIHIVAPPAADVDLERALEARYGLDEVLIATPHGDAPDAVRAALGAVAARRLARELHGDEVVALTWGSTLLSVVDALAPEDWPDLRVVQGLGGLGEPDADVYGVDLVHRTAQAFRARARMLPAPGIVPTSEVRAALLADPQIADTLALAARADVGLVGIGRPTPDSVVMQARILDGATMDELRALGAVGDIGLRFFDAGGRSIEHEINDRIIGLTLAQWASISRVIGVAGGEAKFDVIRAALRGHLIDVLVTDPATAHSLLED